MLTLSRVALSLLFCLWVGTATALPADSIFASEKIDINTASYEELQKIKGVGPVTANRIMEMRQNCYFYPLSSLTEVKGMGEATLKKIEGEGKAFVQPPPSAGNVILCQDSKKIEKDQGQGNPEKAEAEPQRTELIDINTASEKELQRLAGVGEVFAQRIIEARPFYLLDELNKVDGIGSKTLENIKKQGIAWIDPKLEPPQTEKGLDYYQTGPAALSETVKDPGSIEGNKSTERPSVPFSAITLAIFSGIIILILKKKLKNPLTTD